MNKKILVVAHIFYHEMWPLIADKIENIKGYDFDLVVSTTSNLEELTDRVHERFPSAKVHLVENRGYDIWPFIKVLECVNLSDYDYVVKLHTKRDMGKTVAIIRDKFFFRGTKWRDFLLSFVSTKEIFDICISTFETNPKVGMINCHRLFDSTKKSSQDPHLIYCREETNKLLKSVGISVDSDASVNYIAGTMFICRAKILEPLLRMNLSSERFGPANRQNENDLAHVTERLFGGLTTSQGYVLTDPYTSFLDDLKFFPHCLKCRLFLLLVRHRFLSKVCRFLFRIDTKNEEKIIKIFKIAVFRYKKSQH
ncbi:MAG: rhamnan synthesis F family protein [Succinivibrio sp.]